MERNIQTVKFCDKGEQVARLSSMKDSYLLNSNFIEEIERIQTLKMQCQKDLTQFLTAKKFESQESSLVIEKSVKIKKSKKNKKKVPLKNPVTDLNPHVYDILDILLQKYSDSISRKLLISKVRSHPQNQPKQTFLSVVEFLQNQFDYFSSEFTEIISQNRDKIQFGQFLSISDPLPDQFCEMIIRDFPDLKGFISNFYHSTLSNQEKNAFIMLPGRIALLLFNPEDSQLSVDQQMLGLQKQSIKLDDDGGDTSTSAEQKKNKKKKNRKRKNKKNKNPREQNQSQGVGQVQVDQIIQCQRRIDEDARLSKLINLMECIEIDDKNRHPCNVTQEWLDQMNQFQHYT